MSCNSVVCCNRELGALSHVVLRNPTIRKIHTLSEIYVKNGHHASNRGNLALHSTIIKMSSKHKLKIMQEWKIKCIKVLKNHKQTKKATNLKIHDNSANKI